MKKARLVLLVALAVSLSTGSLHAASAKVDKLREGWKAYCRRDNVRAGQLMEEAKRELEADPARAEDLAECLTKLGDYYLAMDRYREAEPILSQALAMDEKMYWPSHPFAMRARWLLITGCLHLGGESFKRAGRLLEQQLALDQATYGAHARACQRDLETLSRWYQDAGQYDKCIAICKRMVAPYRKRLETGTIRRWEQVDYLTRAFNLEIACLRRLGQKQAALAVSRDLNKLPKLAPK